MSVKGISKKSIVLIHGHFNDEFFDGLKSRKVKNVFVLEGRPDFKTAQKAVTKLLKRGIKPTIISDNMAGFLFFKEYVKEVWVSYLTGDKDGVMCSVGGMILAVLGKKHKIPVKAIYADGKVKFLGHPKDVCFFNGNRIAPVKTEAYVPLVDWVNRKYLSEVY